MTTTAVLPVLGDGFVRLEATMGGDLSVVRAAKTSFMKTGVEELDASNIPLIGFLMRNRHGTPFEHNAFTFHVRCPIFVSREWFCHRIGWSYNEFSTRYSEMPEGGYVPAPVDLRTQVGKPGHYTFEPLADPDGTIRAELGEANDEGHERYLWLLQKGVAKEVARNVLPLSMWTEFYATCNARSIMNFLALRNSPHALREIRFYAEAVEEFFSQAMPHTYSAFEKGAQVVPNQDDVDAMVADVEAYLASQGGWAGFDSERFIQESVLPGLVRHRVAP